MRSENDFAALVGKNQFVIVANHNGQRVYASARGMSARFDSNLEFAYVFDAQDNEQMKLAYYRVIAKMKSIDPETVKIERMQVCES